MTPVLIFLIILALIAVWLLLSNAFNWVGNKIYKVFNKTKNIIENNEEEEI